MNSLNWVASLLIIFGAHCGLAIENSSPVRSAEFDSVVSLNIYFNNGDFGTCGGVAITNGYILTAAHCFAGSDGVSKIEVNFGESRQFKNGQYYFKSTEKKEGLFVGRDSSLIEKVLGTIPVGYDYGLVSVDIPKQTPLAPLLSESEFNSVINNSSSYTFKAISINFMEYMSSMETRRGREWQGIKYKGLLERDKYLTPPRKSMLMVQPGDSGSPMFVKVSGKWFVIGVTKGMRTRYPSGSAYAAVFAEKL